MSNKGELADRMAAFTMGQITWPDLSSRAHCMTCSHFAPTTRMERGRCSLVLARHRVNGVVFNGDARACAEHVQLVAR